MTNENTTNIEIGISIEDAFERLKKNVDIILSTSPLIVREYTGYLAASTGKMIRAQALLTCALDKDNLVHPDGVAFGTAIEILHLATLVHDDVIDNADLRRGKPSLQKKHGKRTAVICGDYLLCVALKTAAAVSDKNDYKDRTLPDYMSKVCLGELGQHINNGNFNLTVYRYLKIISGKTAALFEAAFHSGAIIMDKEVSHDVLREYSKLGRYLGMIFQLTDDCMDFESTENVALKPVQSDFEQNVITLPLIHAFSKRGELKESAIKGTLTRKDINKVVESTGGILYTRLMAKKYYDKSMNIIKALDASDEKKALLQELLEKAYRVF
jgi:heptaprenyl diphosphate synthase